MFEQEILAHTLALYNFIRIFVCVYFFDLLAELNCVIDNLISVLFCHAFSMSVQDVLAPIHKGERSSGEEWPWPQTHLGTEGWSNRQYWSMIKLPGQHIDGKIMWHILEAGNSYRTFRALCTKDLLGSRTAERDKWPFRSHFRACSSSIINFTHICHTIFVIFYKSFSSQTGKYKFRIFLWNWSKI